MGVFVVLLGAFFFLVRAIQKKEEQKSMDAILKAERKLGHDVSSAMSTVMAVAQTSKGISRARKGSRCFPPASGSKIV